MKAKKDGKKKLKELVKPRPVDEGLLYRVESLCGELREIDCPSLRRYSGSDTGDEDDVLF